MANGDDQEDKDEDDATSCQTRNESLVRHVMTK
ncbi:hypothetical protein MY10362_004577 [Beauveria mimosiformis]